MRSTLLAIGILCYGIIGFANPPVRTIIAGHILNREANDTTRINIFVYDAEILDHSKMPQYNKSSVNGYFKFELFIDHPVHMSIITKSPDKHDKSYTFTYIPKYPIDGEYGFLIEPGDSINVGNLEAQSNLTNINFSGRGSEKLLCIQTILKCASLYEFPVFHPNTPLLKDSVVRMINDNLNIFKQKISSAAFSIIKSQYVCLLATDVSGKNFAINGNSHLGKIPENFYNLNIKDRSLIFAWPFLNKLLRQEAWALWAKENKKPYPTDAEEGPFEQEYLDALVKYIPPSSLKQQILAKYIFHSLVKHGIEQESLDNLLLSLNELKLGDNYTNQIWEVYKAMQENLKKGTAAYPFCLPDTSNKIICMNDLKGKVVVLDFMFNGCPGCAQLVPNLSKVESSFAGNNDVAFVSISIDRDEFTLKRAIGKYCLRSSIALYTNGEKDKHPIIDFYQIDAYPRIVVIDKSGNIITARAPDPRFEGGERQLVDLIKSFINVRESTPKYISY